MIRLGRRVLIDLFTNHIISVEDIAALMCVTFAAPAVTYRPPVPMQISAFGGRAVSRPQQLALRVLELGRAQRTVDAWSAPRVPPTLAVEVNN
jgi:hypothetical protein